MEKMPATIGGLAWSTFDAEVDTAIKDLENWRTDGCRPLSTS
jgi:hypothetical protein